MAQTLTASVLLMEDCLPAPWQGALACSHPPRSAPTLTQGRWAQRERLDAHATRAAARGQGFLRPGAAAGVCVASGHRGLPGAAHTRDAVRVWGAIVGRCVRDMQGQATFPRGMHGSAPGMTSTRLLSRRGIMDARFFGWLPRGAAVINVSRGECGAGRRGTPDTWMLPAPDSCLFLTVATCAFCPTGAHVVEPDLLAALDSGHLSAAVLDVFEQVCTCRCALAGVRTACGLASRSWLSLGSAGAGQPSLRARQLVLPGRACAKAAVSGALQQLTGAPALHPHPPAHTRRSRCRPSRPCGSTPECGCSPTCQASPTCPPRQSRWRACGRRCRRGSRCRQALRLTGLGATERHAVM